MDFSQDLHKKFMTFKRNLNKYFEDNKIINEKKKDALLALLDDDLKELLQQVYTPEELKTLLYTEILARLEHELTPRQQLVVRTVFYTSRRGPGELLQNWAQRLRCLANLCRFGNEYQVVLRDVFISGLGANTKLQRKLLEYLNLHSDFDETLYFAQQIENTLRAQMEKEMLLAKSKNYDLYNSDDFTASAPDSLNKQVTMNNNTVGTIAQIDTKINNILNQERGKTAINPLPYKLRNALSTFRGRDEYLKTLADTLNDSEVNVVVVHGLSGVGKSELSNQFAWRHIQRYHKNIIWIRAERLEEELLNLARELDVNTRHTAVEGTSDRPLTQIKKDFYSKLVTRGPCLLVFDNVLNKDSITKFLPDDRHKDIRVLITSPSPHWDGIHNFELQPLTNEECKVILRPVIQNILQSKSQNICLNDLNSIISGIPLAVQICGAYISYECRPFKSNFDLCTYVDKLKRKIEIYENVSSIISDPYYNKSIYCSFMITLERIREITKYPKITDILEILNVCAYLNVKAMPLSLLEDICRPMDLAGAIQILDDFFLIFSDDASQIYMHKLIQNAIILHQEESKENYTYFQKVLVYFLTCSERFEIQLNSVLSHAQRFTTAILDLYQNQLYTRKLLHVLVIHDCFPVLESIFEHIMDSEKIIKIVRDNNLVHVAVRYDKREILKYLLNYEDDVDRLDGEGLSPLMVAVALGLEDVAELLLSRTDKARKAESHNDTLLHLTAIYGHFNLCSILMNIGHSDQIKNSDGNYAIHEAAKHGHLEVIKSLISTDPDSTKLTNEEGNFPVHLAAIAGHIHVLRYFLENLKLPVDITGQGDRTSLMLAAGSGQTEAVRYLLELDASKDICDSEWNWSALHHASCNNHLDIVVLLISAGCDINIQNKFGGESPLHLAASRGHLDVVRVLINAKANVNILNNTHDTPLHLAANIGHLTMVHVLIDAKTNINQQNILGYTPLHQASSRGDLGVVRALCATGARGDLHTRNGYTPLDLASRREKVNVCAFLRERFPEVEKN